MITAVALTVSLAAAAVAAAGTWTVVSVPASPAHTNAVLSGGSALSATDGWAVGSTFGAAGQPPPPPVAYHWNGTAWSLVPTPNVAADERSNSLTAVNASSATDAWAVGDSTSGGYSGSADSLYEHWNGTAWSVVPGFDAGELTGVADFGPTNAWAVSNLGTVVHWDGKAWAAVTTPRPSTVENSLVGLSADGPNDIWAVGTYTSTPSYANGAYALHFNGSSWGVMKLAQPPVGTVLLSMAGVTAVSPTDVWLVGNADSGPYVEHFDGTKWNLVPLPSTLHYPSLNAITARSASDVWAFGRVYTNAQGTTSTLLLLHWNGTRWAISPSPTGDAYSEIYGAATAPGSGPVWAYGVNSTNQPLVLSTP